MCERCDAFEAEKQRLVNIAKKNVIPCLVCANPNVVAIGTWIPGQRMILAVGGNKKFTPVFCFWLCGDHMPDTEENGRLIERAILRDVRTGKRFHVQGG